MGTSIKSSESEYIYTIITDLNSRGRDDSFESWVWTVNGYGVIKTETCYSTKSEWNLFYDLLITADGDVLMSNCQDDDGEIYPCNEAKLTDCQVNH